MIIPRPALTCIAQSLAQRMVAAKLRDRVNTGPALLPSFEARLSEGSGGLLQARVKQTLPGNSVSGAALPRERSLLAGRIAAMVLAVAAVTAATRAHASAEPNTRLVKCDGESCLLITGERDSAQSAVKINGHPVSVQGGRHWRAELPLSRVRELSAPFARSIEVTVYNAESGGATTRDADLPIGLMGHTDLASLIVRAR